nr:hypothetical protein [Spirochaetota bacterium]
MQKYTIRPGQQRVFRQRVTTLFLLIAMMLLMLLLRIAYLQIIKVGEYEARSEQNRVRLVPIMAYRGEIYDRNFKQKLIANRK